MSWFPHILNPWSAAIAAAAAIPALLVLYFLKLRRREMSVPSTLLWRKAIQDLQVNAPFQKLRRNLLLLLQLILLCLLILALARPVANYTPGPGSTTVILIDRSASMAARDGGEGRTRLQEAKRRAKDLVAGMGRNSTAMVIAFDDAPEMLQTFTTDTNLLNSAIDRIRQTDRKTDLRTAYQVAEAQFVNYDPEQLRAGGGKESPDVRLLSDGRTLNENELSLKSKLTFEKIGSDDTGNIAVVALSAKRNYERPTQVQVFARLANYGPEPVSAPVSLTVDGEQVQTALRDTFLLPERWDEPRRQAYEKESGKSHRDSVEFKLDLTQAAIIKVEQMHKEGDALAADDAAEVIVPPPKQLAVLLVTDQNYFLERAIRSLNLKNPDVMHPQAYEDKADTAQKYDVIIFDNYKPTKLPEAGNFLWFGVVPDNIRTKVVTVGGSGNGSGATSQPAPAAGAAGEGARPVILEDIGVLDWKRDHPILKDLGLAKLYVARALKLNVPLDQQVLVDGLKGPLVVLDREPKSVHLIVAFDLLQSNWPLKPSFPIFLYQALQYLAVGSDMDVRQSYEPGASPRIPRANLLKADPNLKKVRVEGPDGEQTAPVPAAGDFVLPAMNRVGLYKTDPPIPQFERMAVNLLDANESNLLPNDKAPGNIGDVEGAAKSKRRLELWWWLALGALGMLFVEWWVYTRRVHL